MPPTWAILSLIAIYFDINNIILLGIVGAVAATCGRLTLAKLSHILIRNRILSEKSRKNIDDIKIHLEEKRTLTFGIFLFYAFSPFPSNQLFIAYGLTQMPLRRIAAPFFLGRVASYTILAFTAFTISERLAVESFKAGAFFSAYFILTQLFTFVPLYFFVKIDWHLLFTEKKVRFKK